jgi:hypothetical protein
MTLIMHLQSYSELPSTTKKSKAYSGAREQLFSFWHVSILEWVPSTQRGKTHQRFPRNILVHE